MTRLAEMTPVSLANGSVITEASACFSAPSLDASSLPLARWCFYSRFRSRALPISKLAPALTSELEAPIFTGGASSDLTLVLSIRHVERTAEFWRQSARFACWISK